MMIVFDRNMLRLIITTKMLYHKECECEYCNYNLILWAAEPHLLKILRSNQRFGRDCCFNLQDCPKEHQQLNYPEVCRNNRIRNSGNYISNHTALSQDK